VPAGPHGRYEAIDPELPVKLDPARCEAVGPRRSPLEGFAFLLWFGRSPGGASETRRPPLADTAAMARPGGPSRAPRAPDGFMVAGETEARADQWLLELE